MQLSLAAMDQASKPRRQERSLESVATGFRVNSNIEVLMNMLTVANFSLSDESLIDS